MSAQALKNIQIIETIFREVQELFSQIAHQHNLVQKLNSYNPEFRSVAFEAASMCIALKDLKSEMALPNWKNFLYLFASAHTTQFYIGLGWALAQQQLSPNLFWDELKTNYRHRVLDGYGYYEGMFRRRKSMLQQLYPDWCNERCLPHYDQGLGRSIWYVSKANIQTSADTVVAFQQNRQAALWRGIGTAVAYAGGCTENELRELQHAAGIYASELFNGATLAANSRKEADCMTDSTALALQLWK